MMTWRDMQSFELYLKNCTNNQVLGVLEKEKSAGRKEYAVLAKMEAKERGIYHGFYSGDLQGL
jgi:hypothetical protein